MDSTLKQASRVAALHTPLGADVLALARLDVGEGLSELFEVRIEAFSKEKELDFNDAVGQHCWVAFSTSSGAERVFDGILVEAHQLGPRNNLHAYRLVLKPWLWLLSRTTDCRIFSDLTMPGGNTSVPEIIKRIFEDAGLSDFRFSLSESYSPLEYCVQYRETDLAFVSRLMEQHGIYYFFEHEAGKHTMVLADSKSAHRPIPGHSSIRFVPFIENERASFDRIYRISGQRRLRTGRVALNDYDYLKPKAKLLAESSGREPYARADMEYYDYPGKYLDLGEGEKLARIRLEAEQALDHRRHAAGDIVNVLPGGTFTLERHPNGSENIQYLVVRATHAFVAQDYRTTGEEEPTGDTYFGNYELLPMDIPFRAPPLTERPVVHGPQTAKVVGKAGEEIDVDEHGRITVQFYWDREKTPSCRVRLAQVWSGKSWGGIFIPRVDQEVIVEFIEGDPDRPLVIGTVYNADNTVPYDLPAEKTIGGLKSDSTKGGGGYNEFVFDDKKGSELVRGHAQKDLEFKILNDETWKITRDSTTDVGRDIKVDAGNTITITADVQIELRVGTNNIVIDKKGIAITGMVTEVKGTTILDLKGGVVTIN